MTSLPPFRRILTPNSIVLGEPTKSIAPAGPPSVASLTCFTASGAALSIVATAPICRACALLPINVGDNHFALNCGRRNVHRAAADAARANDHQMVVRAQMPARLFECRKRRDAGAGIRRSEALRHALMRKEIAAIWHDYVCAIAAGSS